MRISLGNSKEIRRHWLVVVETYLDLDCGSCHSGWPGWPSESDLSFLEANRKSSLQCDVLMFTDSLLYGLFFPIVCFNLLVLAVRAYNKNGQMCVLWPYGVEKIVEKMNYLYLIIFIPELFPKHIKWHCSYRNGFIYWYTFLID